MRGEGVRDHGEEAEEEGGREPQAGSQLRAEPHALTDHRTLSPGLS